MDQPVIAPDFRHIGTWIFDLDNTLYRASSNLFAEIEHRMNLFIMADMGLSEPEAKTLRSGYYRRYGSTLAGLVALHGTDPEAFLAYVHDIDLSALSPNPVLNAAIARLPGKRYVFTNGCRYHAARVLGRIGLADVMDGVFDIRSIAFKPKPMPEAYQTIIEEADIEPSKAAFFEDMAVNLAPAYALGMTTVWIANGSVWSDQGPDAHLTDYDHIHHTIDDLGDFLQTIRV